MNIDPVSKDILPDFKEFEDPPQKGISGIPQDFQRRGTISAGEQNGAQPLTRGDLNKRGVGGWREYQVPCGTSSRSGGRGCNLPRPVFPPGHRR